LTPLITTNSYGLQNTDSCENPHESAINGCSVMQVRKLAQGDTVRVVNDEKTVRALQSGHGGWNSEMKNVRMHDQFEKLIN